MNRVVVKPSNILVTEDDFACLIDFGIARAAEATKLTSTGATIGTLAYMAPERLQHLSFGPAGLEDRTPHVVDHRGFVGERRGDGSVANGRHDGL
jgi:serine/threonine protein kinase